MIGMPVAVCDIAVQYRFKFTYMHDAMPHSAIKIINNNNNNNNIYLLQLGCHPVAEVILHVNKI